MPAMPDSSGAGRGGKVIDEVSEEGGVGRANGGGDVAGSARLEGSGGGGGERRGRRDKGGSSEADAPAQAKEAAVHFECISPFVVHKELSTLLCHLGV